MCTFSYSPIIIAPESQAYLTNYMRTYFVLYKCDEKEFIGKYFFYTEIDPGGFADYQWYKSSPADIEYEENDHILHFYTLSGKHFAFQISSINEKNLKQLSYLWNNL